MFGSMDKVIYYCFILFWVRTCSKLFYHVSLQDNAKTSLIQIKMCHTTPSRDQTKFLGQVQDSSQSSDYCSLKKLILSGLNNFPYELNMCKAIFRLNHMPRESSSCITFNIASTYPCRTQETHWVWYEVLIGLDSGTPLSLQNFIGV